MIVGETRPRRKSRSARIATVGVRATTVTMRGPGRAGGRLRNVTLNVVEAIELAPPEGEEAIRWVLAWKKSYLYSGASRYSYSYSNQGHQ